MVVLRINSDGWYFWCMISGEIHLRDVLSILDERMDDTGEFITHSIGFITCAKFKGRDRGRYVVLKHAYAVGLKQNVKENYMRGLKDVITGDIRSAYIHLIIMFDNKKVVW